MAPPSGNKSPNKETSGSRDKAKPRLDVTTAKPALTHSPFAALSGASAPSAAAVPAPDAGPGAAATSAKPPPADSPRAAALSPGAAPAASAPKPRGRLSLRRETKHRGGKTVVIVSGFAQLPGISERELEELLQQLKQRLGCGGSVLTRELLLQGDRPAQVAALLREHGFRVDGVTS